MVNKKNSPWAHLQNEGQLSGPYIHRSVKPAADDFYVTVSDRQHQAPDVLAFDLYGEWRLWWLIPLLNELEDPTFDLQAGLEVRCPSIVRAKSFG